MEIEYRIFTGGLVSVFKGMELIYLLIVKRGLSEIRLMITIVLTFQIGIF